MVRRHFEQVAGEAKKYQNLSMEALEAGDRPAYEAANQLANEAYSKSFFMQVALSATFFWPIFFVLGWLQYRFFELEFPIPFTGLSLGYIGVFILLYLLAYFLFNRLKYRLPYLRRIKAILNANNLQRGTSPALAGLRLAGPAGGPPSPSGQG